MVRHGRGAIDRRVIAASRDQTDAFASYACTTRDMRE
jgi:hypothetical protein